MRNLNRPWTDDERKRLGEEIDAGVSIERAVTIFGHSSKSLKCQAYHLGKQFFSVKLRRAATKELEQQKVLFPRSVPIKKTFEQKETARRAAEAAARALRRLA